MSLPATGWRLFRCPVPSSSTAGGPRDRGAAKDNRGVSVDDPDRDGVLEELTEGDMDLIEFYQLNHPVPAETAITPVRRQWTGVVRECRLCALSCPRLEARCRQPA